MKINGVKLTKKRHWIIDFIKEYYIPIRIILSILIYMGLSYINYKYSNPIMNWLLDEENYGKSGNLILSIFVATPMYILGMILSVVIMWIVLMFFHSLSIHRRYSYLPLSKDELEKLNIVNYIDYLLVVYKVVTKTSKLSKIIYSGHKVFEVSRKAKKDIIEKTLFTFDTENDDIKYIIKHELCELLTCLHGEWISYDISNSPWIGSAEFPINPYSRYFQKAIIEVIYKT